MSHGKGTDSPQICHESRMHSPVQPGNVFWELSSTKLHPQNTGTLPEALYNLPDSGPCQTLISETHSGRRSRSLQSGLGTTPRHIPASLLSKQSWGNKALCRATMSRSPEAAMGTLQLMAAAETHPSLWGLLYQPLLSPPMRLRGPRAKVPEGFCLLIIFSLVWHMCPWGLAEACFL